MAWHRGGKIGPEPTDSPIKRLQERYRFQTPARLMGTVISGTLADRLLGDGHADAGFILTELQKSEVFNPAHFEAWQTLWSWRRRSEAEFTAALQTVEADLDKHAITDPLIILHLAGIFLNLANAKAIADPAEAIQPRFSAYIADLEMQGLLPNDWPKLDWMNPLLEESAFGLGFFCRETDAFQFLRTELRAALDRAYWRDNPNRALMLLGLCTTAPEDFCAALDGGSALAGLPDYRNIPVLTDLEPILFAETVFSRVYGIYDHPLSPFQTRIPRLEASSTAPQSGHPSEREWRHKVRDAAVQLAASASPLRAAQIHSALKGYLGFLDAAPDL